MLIHEVAKTCNITKKAVQYYVESGLIVPNVLENGYKDFSNEDVKQLKEIALYRKLGLGIGEIKRVLQNPKEVSSILYQRTLDLEREKEKQELLKRLETGESLEKLESEIDSLTSGTIIIKKLLELFPGFYGKFISLNFSRYLTGEMETEEQMKAFYEIIDFFDNVPDMDLPEDLEEYLEEYASVYLSEEGVEIINHILDEKNTAMQDIELFIKDNKEIIDKYNAVKQTEEFKNAPAVRLMEYMKCFCTSSGYYDRFIPAMRKISPLYDAYYEQMLAANAKFLEIYPDC